MTLNGPGPSLLSALSTWGSSPFNTVSPVLFNPARQPVWARSLLHGVPGLLGPPSKCRILSIGWHQGQKRGWQGAKEPFTGAYYCCSVTQSCLTLCLPGSVVSSAQGIFQARMLEWVAIPFFRGSSRPRDQTQVSYIKDIFFTVWATREGHGTFKYKSWIWVRGAQQGRSSTLRPQLVEKSLFSCEAASQGQGQDRRAGQTQRTCFPKQAPPRLQPRCWLPVCPSR